VPHARCVVSLTKPIRQAQLYKCLLTVMARRRGSCRPLITCQHLVETPAHRRARVLVAEDNVVNQKVIVRLLEKLECRVDVVANGREALEALSQRAYELVCMDCQMPEMDGFEATATFRAREGQRDGHLRLLL